MKTSLALLIALCAIFDDLQAASLKGNIVFKRIEPRFLFSYVFFSDGWVSYKGGKYIAKLNELVSDL